MKTKILIFMATFAFLNGYAQTDGMQKTTNTVNADQEWKAFERVMSKLKKKSKAKKVVMNDTVLELVSHKDRLLNKASVLFETFRQKYPDDKRSWVDQTAYFTTNGQTILLP